MRQIVKLKSVLSRQGLEKVIHAFITTCLAYCNALYVGVSQASPSHLQVIQNAAARLLTQEGAHHSHSGSLHWLPVRYRIDFNILLFVYKCLHGFPPSNLTDFLQLYIASRSLRSAEQVLLAILGTRLKLRREIGLSQLQPQNSGTSCQYILGSLFITCF